MEKSPSLRFIRATLVQHAWYRMLEEDLPQIADGELEEVEDTT